jgi:hypothetical protein
MFNKIFLLRLKHEPSKKSGSSCDHWQPHQPVDLLGGTAPGWSLRSHHIPACLPGIEFPIINQWIYWGRTAPGRSLLRHHIPACLPGIVFTIISQLIYLAGPLLGGVYAAIIYQLAFQV